MPAEQTAAHAELEPSPSGAMAALDLPALALFRELNPEDRRKSSGRGKGKGKGKDNRFAARTFGHVRFAPKIRRAHSHHRAPQENTATPPTSLVMGEDGRMARRPPAQRHRRGGA